MVVVVEMDSKVKELYTALDVLKKKIINQRRLGYDTYISELLLCYAATHIKMYDVTKDRNDYAKCIYLFREIDRESQFEELKFVEEQQIIME